MGKPFWWWALLALALAGWAYAISGACGAARADSPTDVLAQAKRERYEAPVSYKFLDWLAGGDRFAPGFAPSATYAIADWLRPRDLTMTGSLAIISGETAMPTYTKYAPEWGLYLPWVADAVGRTRTPWHIAFEGD